MTIQTKTLIISNFQNGDVPSGTDFQNWIESCVTLGESSAQNMLGELGLAVNTLCGYLGEGCKVGGVVNVPDVNLGGLAGGTGGDVKGEIHVGGVAGQHNIGRAGSRYSG